MNTVLLQGRLAHFISRQVVRVESKGKITLLRFPVPIFGLDVELGEKRRLRKYVKNSMFHIEVVSEIRFALESIGPGTD